MSSTFIYTGDFIADLQTFPTPEIPDDAAFTCGFSGGPTNQQGENNSFYGRKHTNPEKCASYGMLNKTHSKETKQKMSASAMGKAGTMNGRTFPDGRTDEQKKRISEATKLAMKTAKPRVITQVTCPHCDMTGGNSNMKRYHFDNCKTLYK